MHMVAPTYWTADMVRALPDDGQRYETVHGELLVSPSPRERHQAAHRELMIDIGNYLRAEPVGVLYSSPSDISWGRPDVLVQPDLLVVDPIELRSGAWADVRRLLLAVEILSPSSKRADRFTKRTLYQRQGVETYWVVDADARAVEVWTPGSVFPVVEETTLRWHPDGASTALEISLGQLFAR